MEQQLKDFYTHLNDAVITTNNFADGTKFRKREYVDRYSYCGLNRMYRQYLSFDIDKANSASNFEYFNLPAPTIITLNPENAHCHYLYRLHVPVAFHKNSRSAPQDFFEAVQKEMGILLHADQAYNHALTKNPLHQRWRVQTYPTSYDLSDFLEYFDLPKRHHARKLPENISVRGRNDELFHTLRMWAYRAVHSAANFVNWRADVQEQAAEINVDFDFPLPYKEVVHTADSVAKWTWKYSYKLGNSQPKILQFTDESPEVRMSMGAAYTNALRCEKTLQTLRNAVKTLSLKEGDKAIVNRLVQHTGMNIKTVRKYLPKIFSEG